MPEHLRLSSDNPLTLTKSSGNTVSVYFQQNNLNLIISIVNITPSTIC